MKIAEIYTSQQGEGRFTGEPSVFVRVSGCNLRCWFCDTPYTSWRPEGADVSLEEILAQVQAENIKHVVITGGEPFLFAELIPLTEQLSDLGRLITIETAGTLYLPVVCDLMSISPKLSNSTPSSLQDPYWHERHQRSRFSPSVINKLLSNYDYQLKFVVDQPDDLEEVESYLGSLDAWDPSRVWLMPQGVGIEELRDKKPWIEAHCNRLGYHFCPRLHIEWYGNRRGV